MKLLTWKEYLIKAIFLVCHFPSLLCNAFRVIAVFPEMLFYQLDQSNIWRRDRQNSWLHKEPSPRYHSLRCNTNPNKEQKHNYMLFVFLSKVERIFRLLLKVLHDFHSVILIPPRATDCCWSGWNVPQKKKSDEWRPWLQRLFVNNIYDSTRSNICYHNLKRDISFFTWYGPQEWQGKHGIGCKNDEKDIPCHMCRQFRAYNFGLISFAPNAVKTETYKDFRKHVARWLPLKNIPATRELRSCRDGKENGDYKRNGWGIGDFPHTSRKSKDTTTRKSCKSILLPSSIILCHFKLQFYTWNFKRNRWQSLTWQ